MSEVHLSPKEEMLTTTEHRYSLCKNVFVKQMVLENVGDDIKGHAHEYDHLTLLSYGQVHAFVGDKEKIFTAPCIILTEAKKRHRFVALKPMTVLSCIHVLRDENGDIIPDDARIEQQLAAEKNILTKEEYKNITTGVEY